MQRCVHLYRYVLGERICLHVWRGVEACSKVCIAQKNGSNLMPVGKSHTIYLPILFNYCVTFRNLFILFRCDNFVREWDTDQQ